MAGGMRPLVLLVEDHQDTRQMYAEFLAFDYEIAEAATGRDALVAMEDRRPDLVITDLSLPDIDGFELLKRIQEDPHLRRVPVICLSGYGGFGDNQPAATGFTKLLQKPCLPDTLAGAVAEVLKSGLGSLNSS